MRTAFMEALVDLAARDERIWLLCGDVGYSVVERFADRFPDRYINAGVAEQNMTGVAAGLALSGKVVFTYSIANFPVMRCLEQIRNDICAHRLPVTIVAVGGGVAYGTSGYTHHAVEDLAALRALPHLAVLAPGDPVEARLATEAAVAWGGPCYLRLGKAGEPVIHQADPPFAIGRAIPLRSGRDVTLVGTGGMLRATRDAAVLLAERGVDAGVLSMPTVAPLDVATIERECSASGRVCVVEEHGAAGGLSDAVARALAERPGRAVLGLTLDVPALLTNRSTGGQAALLARAGLTPEGIARRVEQWLRA